MTGDLLNNLLRILPRGFIILIVCVFLGLIIVVISLIGYAVFNNRTVSIGIITINGEDDGQTSQPATTEYEESEMIGYYYTLDDKKNSVCTQENLTMKWFDDGKKISGHAEADVHKSGGGMVKRHWIYEGVRHGNDLSLFYITDKVAPTGVGVNYLMSMGGAYSGYWLGIDFPSGDRVQCPYVLVNASDEMHMNETCETRWPDIFNDDNKCKRLK